MRKLDEHGVTFRSHIDGAMVELSPERAIEIQALLGADIAMELDECLRLPADARGDRSAPWSCRCAGPSARKRAFESSAREGYALFGIVQGGDDSRLRRQSARELADIGFDGYAIGGLAVGEPQEVMLEVVDETVPVLPADRPRYLMGVGKPDDLARSGRARHRHVRLRAADAQRPPRHGLHALRRDQPVAMRAMPTIRGRSTRQSAHPAARDLFARLSAPSRQGERDARPVLLSTINLAYYQELMAGMREAIEAGRFATFRADANAGWERGDLPACEGARGLR